MEPDFLARAGGQTGAIAKETGEGVERFTGDEQWRLVTATLVVLILGVNCKKWRLSR